MAAGIGPIPFILSADVVVIPVAGAGGRIGALNESAGVVDGGQFFCGVEIAGVWPNLDMDVAGAVLAIGSGDVIGSDLNPVDENIELVIVGLAVGIEVDSGGGDVVADAGAAPAAGHPMGGAGGTVGTGFERRIVAAGGVDAFFGRGAVGALGSAGAAAGVGI